MTAAPKAQRIPETAFTEQLLTLAALKGWRTMHIRPAANDRGRHRTPVAGHGKGWPDLTLVRLNEPGRDTQARALTGAASFAGGLSNLRSLLPYRGARLIFAELKVDGEYPKPEQRAWLADLALTGAEVYVWRPSDWDDIVEALS